MMSKLFVLGLMGFLQSVIFVLIFMQILDLPDTELMGYLPLEIMLSFFLTVFASTAFGLVISTMVSNSDRAMGLTPIVLIPQLIFNGLVFKLEGISEWLSNLAISKWTARAFSISFDLNSTPMEMETKAALPPRDLPSYYDHRIELLFQNWSILIGIVILCTIVSLYILKRKDTK